MALFSNPQVPTTMTAEMTRLTAGSSHSQPVSPIEDPGDDDPGGDQGIGRHMGKGALQVEVAIAARREQQCRRPVDDDADRRDPDHDGAGERDRFAEAQNRLPGDAAGDHQQNDRVGECGQDRGRAQPVGEPPARFAAAQHRRTPGEAEPERIAEIVAGIGEQSERAGDYSGDRLAADINEVQRDPDRKGAPVIRARMAVDGVIVRHRARLSGNAPRI